MRELSLAIPLLFVLIGCRVERMQVLSFEDLGHTEVSLEKNNYLTIRAMPAPNSFAVITHYNFQKLELSSSVSYFLTLYLETGDKPAVPEIKWKEGLEVTIPCDSFDFSKDSIYYRDDKGEYKLNIGTYQTWQDYLKSRGLFKYWEKSDTKE